MAKTTRSRYFGTILYPEDPQFDNKLQAVTCQDYLMILHNRDVDDDGNPKKEHYHVIIQFEDAKTVSSVAKKIGCSENQIQVFTKQKGKDVDGYIRYMTHADQPDKALYHVTDFVGSPSLIKRADRVVKSSIEKLTTEDYLCMICDKIASGECKNVQELTMFCKSNGCLNVLARNWYFLKTLFDVNKHSTNTLN